MAIVDASLLSELDHLSKVAGMYVSKANEDEWMAVSFFVTI